MNDESEVAAFQPSGAWHADWPYDVSTSVEVRALITGPAAARAVECFAEDLTPDPDADVSDDVRLYHWGGFTAEITSPAGDGPWQVVLASAGEDGFESVQTAADNLVEALRSAPGEVQIAWHELPAARLG